MRIGVVAGEASGDALGANLIRAVRAHYPQAVFEGVAGPHMMALGAQSLFPMEALSVRGYWEVLRSLPHLLFIRRQLTQYFLSNPPDLFVGIDAPDFNLTLEKNLKLAGIPTVQMVAPTVWAWRANRLPKIREAVTELLTTFPFEKAIFERAGIPVTDIGHPLAQQLAAPINQTGARQRLQLGRAAPVIALLPGSRMSELEFHAQLFVETAGLLKRYFNDAIFLVPLINAQTRAVFESAVRRSGRDSNIKILHGQAHDVLAAADAALVASGTATLEAALLKCPMVVTYRLSAFTAWIVRRRKTSQFVALPNIILDRAVVPEMIQEDATPEILAAKMAEVITNPVLRSSMLEAFAELQRMLYQDSEACILAGIERALSHGR